MRNLSVKVVVCIQRSHYKFSFKKNNFLNIIKWFNSNHIKIIQLIFNAHWETIITTP